jgi:alginate O-acetyltransferase complex protein AlgI
VLWGTLHGLALVVCSLWRRYGPRLPALGGWALTVIFVLLTGVFFRAGTLDAALNIFHGLTVPPNLSEGKRLWPLVIVPLMAFLLPATQDMVERVMQRPRPWLGVVGGLGLLAILILLGEGNVRGFAYYQF